MMAAIGEVGEVLCDGAEHVVVRLFGRIEDRKLMFKHPEELGDVLVFFV